MLKADARQSEKSRAAASESEPSRLEVIRIDGSPHDWFEARAPKCTLLVMVDDATSRLMRMQLVPAETTFNHFAAARAYILQRQRVIDGSDGARGDIRYSAQIGDIYTWGFTSNAKLLTGSTFSYILRAA